VDTVADTATTNEEAAVVIDVLDNDNDIPTTGTLTATVPANGTVGIDQNGTLNDPSDDILTYTPNIGHTGTDTFQYTLCGADNVCDTALVVVTIVPKADFRPILFSANANVIGSSGIIDFTVLIGEYKGTDSDGLRDVEFRIAKIAELDITFNSSLTLLNGTVVNNSDWAYDGSHPFLHKFTYVGNGGIFLANTGKSIGINAVLNPLANTKGQFPLKITIRSRSGGETVTNNNNDFDYILFNNTGN
jgi:hypothetical protein